MIDIAAAFVTSCTEEFSEGVTDINESVGNVETCIKESWSSADNVETGIKESWSSADNVETDIKEFWSSDESNCASFWGVCCTLVEDGTDVEFKG